MEKATQLTIKDKEAVLKMAGVEVRRNAFGNWEALDTINDHLLITTAFYKQTVDMMFKQLCNQP